MRILLVEDQTALAEQVAAKIHSAGYEVDVRASIESALEALDGCAYSLALLDRRLPDGDGVSIVPRLRQRQPEIRILMLTALDAVDERIEGLDAGADDYLTKPFNLDEMIARIRANLRKQSPKNASVLKIGDLTIAADRRVRRRGEYVVFTRRELILLEALARRANCVVSRETLSAELYGPGMDVQDHALTSIISRLRARLAELDARVEIRSARALGYILRETPAAEARG